MRKHLISKIAALAALSFLSCIALLISSYALAQPPTNNVIFDGSTTYSPCGSSSCCLEFTDTIQTSTSTVDVYLWDNGSTGPNCFTSGCWSGQSTPTETFQSGSNYDDFQIAASGLDPMLVGPFPYVINVYICGPYDCLQNYDEYTWQAGSASGTYQPLYETSCEASNIPGCGTFCSYITVAPAGTPYADCGTEICVWNQSGSLADTVTINFNPPINWSTPCPPNSGGVKCPLNSSDNHSWTNYLGCENCWVESDGPGTGDMTFTHGPGCPPIPCGGLTSCSDPLCIFIPRCLTLKDEVITLVSPAGCSGQDDGAHIAMKIKDDGTLEQTSVNSGGQNYPNPLGAASGFKTTIPFSTSSQGIASIRIVDQNGKVVLNDNENATYPGQHFFYFTAQDLPSGTYYYTIEFPKGIVIASKTMLVVK